MPKLLPYMYIYKTYTYSVQHFSGDQGLKIAYRLLNDIKTSPKLAST
jgi:hypothetical protein